MCKAIELKLPQKPQIVFVEQSDVIDAKASNRDSSDTEVNPHKSRNDEKLWQLRRLAAKGCAFLRVDAITNYAYSESMPAARQSTLWKSKTIFLQGDNRVGQWSDAASIPVEG